MKRTQPDRDAPGSSQAGSVPARAGSSDVWEEPAVPGAGPQPLTDALSVAESERYERGLELGRGGMGRVVAARDRRLERQVALKEVRVGANQREAAAQLAAEAQLTAGLDHPGILAIHDAGRDSRGQPYYVMRLVRGKTLAQAAAGLPTLADRLRLIQSLLAACHAVAHAHERQIVHRDLKPDNLLVGPHGETQVADWGLACTLAQAAAGGVLGTAGFMAPEVAAGQPASPRSDVYSLGATLVAVLHAAPADADLPRLAAALPPELSAIAERCLEPDPQARYPDAAALAEDLSAWLDGRRVAAHSYSAWQLASRLARTFRIPLIVGLVAVFVVAVVAWQGYRRTVNQRDRAVAAEHASRLAQRQAESSEQAAQKHLAAAYVQAAESAEAAGARPEAETLAAAAIALGPAPEARGVLARLAEGPEARLIADFSLPACRRIRLAPDGRWLLCIQDEAALLLRGEDGSVAWRKAGAFGDGAISSSAGRLFLTDLDYRGRIFELQSGDLVGRDHALLYWPSPISQRDSGWVASVNSNSVQLFDLSPRTGEIFDQIFEGLCSLADPVSAVDFARQPGALLVVCRSGRTFRATVGREPERLESAISVPASFNPSALTVTAEGRVLLGTREGRLWAGGIELGAWSGSGHRVQPSVQALRSGPGAAVAALGEGQGPVVWAQLGEVPVRLPLRDRLAVAVVDEHTVAVAGERLRRFALRPPAVPVRFAASSGLTQAAVSPDGRLLAAGGGDGRLTLWKLQSGEVVRELRLSAGVIKSVDFSPDGRRLAVGMAAAPGFALLDTSTWQPLATPRPVLTKRLGYFASGVLWSNTYGDGFDLISPQGELLPVMGAAALTSQGESEANLPRTGVVHYSNSGELTLIRQGSPQRAEWLASLQWVSAVALSADLRTVAVAEEGRVRLLDVASRQFTREIADSGQRILNLTFSPDDSLLFVAELDLAVRVFRVADGAEVAVLRGHTQRVAQIAFAPGSLGLFTTSWDGSVRRWEAGRLTAPASALQEAIAAHWGLKVEDALRFPVR